MATNNYGATSAAASQPHQDEESQALLNNRPQSNVNTEANDTFYGRTFVHVTTHRKRYFALWLLAAIAAISTVLALHFYHKSKEHHGGHDLQYPVNDLAKSVNNNDNLFSRPPRCESDRSYPIAILLSVFLGYLA
ncbi:hypothetical protein BX616_007594, partial [Lobosporangium transversale]